MWRRGSWPDYLQGETERNLGGLIGYLKKSTDELDLYIDLAGPLDNASAELVKYGEDRIGRIEVVGAGEAEGAIPREEGTREGGDPGGRCVRG